MTDDSEQDGYHDSRFCRIHCCDGAAVTARRPSYRGTTVGTRSSGSLAYAKKLRRNDPDTIQVGYGDSDNGKLIRGCALEQGKALRGNLQVAKIAITVDRLVFLDQAAATESGLANVRGLLDYIRNGPALNHVMFTSDSMRLPP
jgi:hypothetical protein